MLKVHASNNIILDASEGCSTHEILQTKASYRITGLGRSSIYNYMTAGYFPKSVRLGLRLVVWGEERLMNGLPVGYLTLEDVVVNERTAREKI